MRKYVLISAACIGLAFSGKAKAQSANTTSANDMIPMCNFTVRVAEDDNVKDLNWLQSFQAGYCAGVVRGVTNLGGYFNVCIPPGSQEGQSLHIIMAYLKNNPALWHEPFEVLSIKALHDAWPCK